MAAHILSGPASCPAASVRIGAVGAEPAPQSGRASITSRTLPTFRIDWDPGERVEWTGLQRRS